MAKQTEFLTSRVSKATKQQITAIAKEERRSISQVVAILVEQALQARQAKREAA